MTQTIDDSRDVGAANVGDQFTVNFNHIGKAVSETGAVSTLSMTARIARIWYFDRHPFCFEFDGSGGLCVAKNEAHEWIIGFGLEQLFIGHVKLRVVQGAVQSLVLRDNL